MESNYPKNYPKAGIKSVFSSIRNIRISLAQAVSHGYFLLKIE